MNRTGGGVTVTKIRKKLQDTFNVKISRQLLTSVMHRRGYTWGRAKKVSKIFQKSETLLGRIRQYLLEYSGALYLQNVMKTHIIAYSDETYCHQRHSSNFTWYKITDKLKNLVCTGSGKGLRFIIVHAMTEWGLIGDGEAVRLRDTHKLEEEKDTAEWIFKGPEKKGDYHRNMNADNYFAWIEKRLIPGFESQFPDKKLIFILDNASYHHARDENYVNPAAMSRKEMIDFMCDVACIGGIRVTRGNSTVTFDLSEARKTSRGGKNSPTKLEMRWALEDFLKTKPELQCSRLKKLFDERDWKLIFTPPYTPALQPIEMAWSIVKGYVAKMFIVDRTVEQTRTQIMNGFYGDDAGHEGLTAKVCKNLIMHSQKVCQEYIDSDPLLSGTLSKLKQVGKLSEEELIQIEDESVDFPELSDESNEAFGSVNAADYDTDDEEEQMSEDEDD